MQKHDIKTFVFFDTETTGIPWQEFNKTRILELCFAAVQVDHLSLGAFPRIVPKINLYFNPRKAIQPAATEINGLSNELLQAQPEFNIFTAGLLVDFLKLQKPPVCLVAHNGNRFDYPILKAELFKAGKELPGDILCVDTLVTFKKLYDSTEPEPEVPIELQDGYDELLCRIMDEIEANEPIKTTVEDVKRRNETTPKKGAAPETSARKGAKRRLFGEPASFKLVDVYEALTKKAPSEFSHQAEIDAFMLIECVAKLGHHFVDEANESAVKISEIPMMRVGRSIRS